MNVLSKIWFHFVAAMECGARNLTNLFLALLMSLLTVPASVQQADDPAATLRFDITRFDVIGNTLLDPAEIARRVALFVGKQKDFSDVQRALEALEIAYRERG